MICDLKYGLSPINRRPSQVLNGVTSPNYIKINIFLILFSLPFSAIFVSILLCLLPFDARKAVSRQLQLLD